VGSPSAGRPASPPKLGAVPVPSSQTPIGKAGAVSHKLARFCAGLSVPHREVETADGRRASGPPPILLPMRGPGAVHPNIQENRCAARLLDPHRHIGWRGRLLAVAGTPIPLGLRPEEDGLTTEPGRHTPESFGASRNGDAYVSFGHAAFVQLADVVQGGGDDSAAIVVGPVI
jgi:hypothetical protein